MNTLHLHWWIAAADWQDCLSAGYLMELQIRCILLRVWITHMPLHTNTLWNLQKNAAALKDGRVGSETQRLKRAEIEKKENSITMCFPPSWFFFFFWACSSFEVKLLNDSKVFCGHSKRRQRATQFLTTGNVCWITEAVKTVSLPFQVGDGCSCTAYKLSRAMTGNHYYACVSIWVTDHSIKAHILDLCAL